MSKHTEPPKCIGADLEWLVDDVTIVDIQLDGESAPRTILATRQPTDAEIAADTRKRPKRRGGAPDETVAAIAADEHGIEVVLIGENEPIHVTGPDYIVEQLRSANA